MNIKEILEQQGWVVEQQTGWLSVWDRRPQFRKISAKGRVAKIVGSSLYVVPAQLHPVTNSLIVEMGTKAEMLKSTSGSSHAEYIGFETSTVSEEKLKTFIEKLKAAIDSMI